MNLRFFLVGNPFVKNSHAKAKPLSHKENASDISKFLDVTKLLEDRSECTAKSELNGRGLCGSKNRSDRKLQDSITPYSSEYYGEYDSLELWGIRERLVDRYGEFHDL